MLALCGVISSIWTLAVARRVKRESPARLPAERACTVISLIDSIQGLAVQHALAAPPFGLAKEEIAQSREAKDPR
jgi:hypothetical protein